MIVNVRWICGFGCCSAVASMSSNEIPIVILIPVGKSPAGIAITPDGKTGLCLQ